MVESWNRWMDECVCGRERAPCPTRMSYSWLAHHVQGSLWLATVLVWAHPIMTNGPKSLCNGTILSLQQMAKLLKRLKTKKKDLNNECHLKSSSFIHLSPSQFFFLLSIFIPFHLAFFQIPSCSHISRFIFTLKLRKKSCGPPATGPIMN